MEKIEHSVRMMVPDSDIQGWLSVLREGRLSEEEIDSMMVHLNEVYRNIRGPVIIEREVEKIKELLTQEHKYHINREEEDYLRMLLKKKLGMTTKEDDHREIPR